MVSQGPARYRSDFIGKNEHNDAEAEVSMLANMCNAGRVQLQRKKRPWLPQVKSLIGEAQIIGSKSHRFRRIRVRSES